MQLLLLVVAAQVSMWEECFRSSMCFQESVDQQIKIAEKQAGAYSCLQDEEKKQEILQKCLHKEKKNKIVNKIQDKIKLKLKQN